VKGRELLKPENVEKIAESMTPQCIGDLAIPTYVRLLAPGSSQVFDLKSAPYAIMRTWCRVAPERCLSGRR